MKELDFTEPMKHAISESLKARNNNEDPFGAVLVDPSGNVVYSSHSSCFLDNDPTAHAEMNVIRQFCKSSGRIHLKGFTLVSSAEPCVMCSGAIKWAKIARVVFAISQSQIQKISGGKAKPTCDSIVNTGNTRIEVIEGFMTEEALQVFRDYSFVPKDQL